MIYTYLHPYPITKICLQETTHSDKLKEHEQETFDSPYETSIICRRKKMNIQTVPFNSSGNAFAVEPKCSKSTRSGSRASAVRCSVSRDVPKLEPFSRSKFDRAVKEPPLIQKAENQIADYCLTVEGDDSYGCWQAYFELKDLEKEAPKEEVERLIMEAGGVKSLISCVHGVADIHKTKKECGKSPKPTKIANTASSPCPIPDGLPKTQEELEEEEKARMPDSPFTRLLRARGRCAAWYSHPPEHETD